MNSKFSVLMSVYIKENPIFLNESLDSIFNNTLMPDEVVLIKDGPLNEKLEQVINKYKNDYCDILKIVSFERNVGLGDALNEGLKHCKYNLVARMDTDDICLRDRFEKQVEFMDNNPEIDVLGSNVLEYDENMLNKQSIKLVPSNHSEICKFLKKRNPFNHMSVMYRKDKVLQSGSYEKMLYFEDYYLWCKMCKLGCRFHNLNECLVNVRGGELMISRRGGFAYIKHIIDFQKAIKKLGIINFIDLWSNLITRILVSLIPDKIRLFLYKKLLRADA